MDSVKQHDRVTGITYFRTWQGWPYLAVVVDLYARRAVGWSMKPKKMESDRVKHERPSLSMAAKVAVAVGASGFWAMGLFAIVNRYWFASTTRYGTVSTHLYTGNEAVFQGMGLILLGCTFLSILQKTPSRAAWVCAVSIIGAVTCMLAPLFITL